MPDLNQTHTEPSEAEKVALANVYNNIANLIKHGMFFGSSAGYVQETLGFLESTAKKLYPTQSGDLPEEVIKDMPKAAKLEVVDNG